MSINRWTQQRRLIWEAIKDRTDHPTAEELYQGLRRDGARVSLATVYRTLRALAREGLLRELHGPGPDRFDPNTSPHYHFRCRVCGRIFDVKIPYKDELDQVERGPGFIVTSHAIVWEGICPACREKGRDAA